MLSRGVSHQDTRVLLGKPPPFPGGAGHWCSSRLARISSISLRGHIQVSPLTVGGGPTAHRGGAGAPSRGHGPGVEQGPGCPPGTHRWGGCRTHLSLGLSHPWGRSTQYGQAPWAGCTLPAWVLREDKGGKFPSKNTAVTPGRRKAAPLPASAAPPSTGLSCRAVLGTQGAAGTSAGRETTTRGGEAEAWQLQTGNCPSPRQVGPQPWCRKRRVTPSAVVFEGSKVKHRQAQCQQDFLRAARSKSQHVPTRESCGSHPAMQRSQLSPMRSSSAHRAD